MDVATVLAEHGFVVDRPDPDVRGWVAVRDPQVLTVSESHAADRFEIAFTLTVDGQPAPVDPATVQARPPATAAEATLRLLARGGLDRLPSVDRRRAGDQAMRLLLSSPLQDHPEIDRAAVAVAELDGREPWDLLPPSVARLAGPDAADRLTADGVMLHRHVVLARAAADRLAAGASRHVTVDGVDVGGVADRLPAWAADALAWLGPQHGLAALAAAGQVG